MDACRPQLCEGLVARVVQVPEDDGRCVGAGEG